MTTLRAHGAARIAAGLGADPGLLAEPDEATRARLLRGDLDEGSLHLAWELARIAPQDTDRPALLRLLWLLVESHKRGSSRLSIADPDALADKAVQLGVEPELAARAATLAGSSHPMIGAPGERRPLIREGPFLYAQRVHAVESRVALAIRARLSAAPCAHSMAAEVAEAPVSLTDRQREAVTSALTRRLTVIRGGPGTGKTAIVVAILRAWLRAVDGELPLSVAVAAPTGKAADRMRRSIESSLEVLTTLPPIDRRLLEHLPAPSTLHRLLGYSPSRRGVRYHRENPLGAKLVVVDEASMVDLELFDRLLAALPATSHLVLLGDAEQLPSVAMGAVFRDLALASSVASSAVPSVELTKSHRMRPDQPAGSNILRVANAINQGRVPPLVEPGPDGLPSAPDAIARVGDALSTELAGVHLFSPDRPPPELSAHRGSLERFLERYYELRIRGDQRIRQLTRDTLLRDGATVTQGKRAEELFSFLDRARLLTITRSAARPTGVEAVNALLHRRRAEERETMMSELHLMAGEPVLVSRNDYERDLFNGDQGLILWTAERGGSPRLSAVFRRGLGFVAHPLAAVRPVLELGYAVTVHKAQGSEHDDVTLLLPDTDSPRLLTREIVYTAITRARRSVLIVGQRELLRRAVGRVVERSTGLAERLRA